MIPEADRNSRQVATPEAQEGAFLLRGWFALVT